MPLEEDEEPLAESSESISLDAALDEVEYIHVAGNEISLGIVTYDGDVAYSTFSREEVATYDSRLPEVIDAIYADGNMLGGMSLRHTMQHWQAQPPTLKVMGEEYYLYSISKLYPYNGGDSVGVTAHIYQMEKTESGIEHSPMGDTKTIFLDLDWLETNFPGALNRIHAAQAMGFVDETLANYVFVLEEKPENAADLPADLSDDLSL